MAHPILDDCLGRLLAKDLEYLTSIVDADGGEEDRNAQWVSARRRWRLEPAGLTDDLVQKLEMHFHMTRGRWKTFVFKDRLDHNHWQVSTDTAPIVIGTGDGSTVDFQLIKLYGSGDDTRTRTITNTISGTVNIYVDGVLQASGTDRTVDHDTGIVTFTTAPANGAVVTAEFQFRTRARFVSDTLPLAPISSRRKYLTSSVELIEVRR